MLKQIFSSFFLFSTIIVKSQCLVAEYKLNGNPNDASGNANNGTVVGAIPSTDRFGNPSGSYHFDGIDDHILIASGSSLDLTNTMTFNVWFISHSPFGFAQTLIGRQRNSTQSGIDFYFSNLNGGINFDDGIANETASGSFSGYHMGKWHMLTTTHDGTDTKLYIDGVLVATEPGSINFAGFTEPFNLGRLGANFSSYLDGDLDDVKIYNCALSGADIDSIFIAESPYAPCGFVVSAVTSPPTCHDGNDGSIDLTVSGSQPPYAFYWNNSQNTEDLSGLVPGNYSIIINDDNGCDTMITYNVSNPAAMNINLSITNPNCGMANGSVAASVLSGGTGPYNFLWSTGETTPMVDSLPAAIYMVNVIDDFGCMAAQTFGLNNTGTLSLSTSVTNATCNGMTDGAINLIVSGGTAPLAYEWSNGVMTQDLSGISQGSYMVEVTDANGCHAMLSANVGENTVDLSNVTMNQPGCGNTNGSISLNPTGGQLPYMYIWSSNAGSSTNSSVSSLGAGNYFVTVTDLNGCAASEMYSLSNPSGPSVVINTISPANCGGTGGAINIGISSGVSPFTYLWDNGETTQDISNLNGGLYSVDVSDDNGCVSSLHILVPGAALAPMTLCMATVNQTDGKVLCLWEKPAVDYISHFNIYRENSVAGQYDYWFTRPYDSTSQWTDVTANSQIRGWRYKMTYVDTCGNESPLGTDHKTIHLSTSAGLTGGVNIAWDHYEGFGYPTFYIERYHSTTGWVTIDSLPSNLFSYFDTTTLTGPLQYAVNIESPNTCDPTRVGVNTSRSNVKNQALSVGSVNDFGNEMDWNIYPNPANNEFYISMENFNGRFYTLKLYNAIGELIMIQKMSSNNMRIDTKDLPEGFYSVELSSDKQNTIKKLIIQK